MAKDSDVLDDAKEAYEIAVEHENLNRRDALDDLRFARLAEQWPEKVRRDRERSGRPCLTINKLPAYIRQIVNDARQNQPSIMVHPQDSVADPKTAEIYNGLIRNIEVTSRADVAYDTALDFAVTMGFGYFRINTEYAHDDTFDLDLRIERIANPFSVYGDPYSNDSDSSDWNTCFVTDLISKDQFKKKYKGAEEVDWEELGYDKLPELWTQDEMILIAEYFTREPAPKTILLLSDQSVVDEEVYAKNKDTYDQSGITVVSEREASGYKVTQRIMTGAEVLEKNDWPGKYIPVIPVYGEDVNVEGRRHLRGLVRDCKDAQRMVNYWRTATVEQVASATRAPWMGKKGTFRTDAAKWATANVENHSYLEYDGDVPPERIEFAGVPAGALQEALNAADDIKSIAGMFDASLGAQSNETSGRAIMARQREGDVSSFHFIDNLSRAIEHGGRILIDLIPLVYTGQRIIRVLGPDDTAQSVPLNTHVVQGPNGQMQPTPGGAPAMGPDGSILSHVFDLSRGKYDLTVETGPSFTTKREEAANQMIELIRAFPQAAPVIGDQLAKNLDWPGAEVISQRLAALLPAALQGGGQQQGQPGAPQDPAAQALEQQKLAQQQMTNQIKMQEVQVDAFRAQTERMQAVTDAQRPVMPPQQTH